MDVIWPKPGKYVLAVSGGIDSIVLLDLLSRRTGLNLVVAHFDHGIRPDSADDATFVEKLAEKYGLAFRKDRVELGHAASEAAAREARYTFLKKVRQEEQATAIITAHHQDDVIETAIINLGRGGGRKGLTALASHEELVRPLLKASKQDIKQHAALNGLVWREDETNEDTRYLRNYIRREVMPRLTFDQKYELVSLIDSQRDINQAIDSLLVKFIADRSKTMLDRLDFMTLPYDVATEIMAAWLRSNGIGDFDRAAINRLVVGAKTARPGKRLDVMRNRYILVSKDSLNLL